MIGSTNGSVQQSSRGKDRGSSAASGFISLVGVQSFQWKSAADGDGNRHHRRVVVDAGRQQFVSTSAAYGNHHLYGRTKRKRDNCSPVSSSSGVRQGQKEPAVVENSNKDSDDDDDDVRSRSRVGIGQEEWKPEVPLWNNKGKVYGRNVVGFHDEVEDFFQWMMPTRFEHESRIGVVSRIRDVVRRIWPDSKVDIFGSFKTGLYLPTSDIDLVICGRWQQLPIYTLHDVLVESGIPRPDNLLVLDKAAVPIVKMTDVQTGIKVDISFNTLNGIRAAELIKFYKKTYPPLPKLIYVLKQFLLQRGLNEVFQGGLSSYALILMAVSFLQSHPRADAKTRHTNLGVLLIEFFELYGRNFNYGKSAVRLCEGGGVVPREQAVIRQMPQTCCHSQSGMTICIEDPLNPCNDVGRGSFYFHRVKSAFEEAYVTLVKLCCEQRLPSSDSSNQKSILSHIVAVSDDVKEFRNRLSSSSLPPKPLRISYALAAHPNRQREMVSTEDPLAPVYVAAPPISNITPHKLPARHKLTPPPPPPPPPKETGRKGDVAVTAASCLSEESSDSVSGVSTATSMSTVSSSCESDGSPSLGQNSDMSISPASSEAPDQAAENGRRRHSSNHWKRADRADLDPDWRSSGRSSECCSEKSGFDKDNDSFSSSSFKENRYRVVNGDSNNRRNHQQQLRADLDPNWRNRGPAEGGDGIWRRQGCAPGEETSTQPVPSDKRPPGFAATAVQMAPPATSATNREQPSTDDQSGKEAAVAAAAAAAAAAAEEITNQNYVVNNSLASSKSSPFKTQTFTKKRKKPSNKNMNSAAAAAAVDANSDCSSGDSEVTNCRFSRVQGQASDKR